MTDHGMALSYGLPTESCGCCDRPLDARDHLVVAAYGDTAALPTSESAVGICRDCRSEVAELVDTWTAITAPPVDGASIAAGYDAITSACSFCDRAIDEDSVVGYECYNTGTDYDDEFDEERHFALCPNCVDVFSEFLAGISDA